MSRTRRITVVGDAVLDRDLLGRVERICPDAPVPVVDVDQTRSGPGGAALTALLSTEARQPQAPPEVTLVAPVGSDEAGAALSEALGAAGVHLVALAQSGPTRVKTRVRSMGQSLMRLDEGGPAHPVGPLPSEALEAIDSADVVVVSCYGAGVSAHEQIRAALASRSARRPVVWDPHPRGAPPVAGCTLVTPNLTEARALTGMPRGTGDEVARRLVDLWAAHSVCVTAGAEGAWLASATGEPVHIPTSPADGDACGAGDRFAATAATSLVAGMTTSEAVVRAVEDATLWVSGGGTSGFRARERDDVAAPPASRENPSGTKRGVVDEVRAAGGTVVATGGCFDILHVGHVTCLEAARRLGDCLVVLLNSDASVRHLKGPGRPVQPAADRARVLLGLGCVDDVVVFDEDSPQEALSALRPDVWVKGGDYEGTPLPEAQQVRSWGGRVVLLPYLSGRSTSALVSEFP